MPAVLDYFGVRDARGLIGVLYDPAHPAFPAELAPLVDACAQAGDAVALGILEKAADWLAGYTSSVIRRTGAKLVGVHGSVLKHNRIVRASFEARLRTSFSDVTICEPSLSPEEAAARLEEIVKALESGTLPLEESLVLYEEGVRLVRDCSRELNEAEQKVKVLQRTSAGTVEPVDFVDAQKAGDET